jgi:calcium-translocating P-type ATPase
LSGGAGLAAASGSITDAALIGTFMLANALAGGIQRVGVTRALARLIDASAVRVRVRREGGEDLTAADRLVIGDVIVVQAGDAVPADCRIITARGLEVDESSLTGESQLVTKVARPSAAANIADRRSMLYSGSSIAAGTGSAVVVALGAQTELGRSAYAAREDQRRPGGVEARLAQLTKVSVPAVLGAGAAVLGIGLLRGQPLRDTLGTGVSLAVAAVPEGLPIVASAAQYSAARRLSRRGALVRNPGTIEALGRVDVLCFDKTGTLTEGRITLHRVWAGGVEQPVDALTHSGWLALRTALRATPEHDDGRSLAHATDQAVADGAAAGGVRAGRAVRIGDGSTDGSGGADGWRMVGELPFEPSRGYHAVLGRTPDEQRLAVKGAPEVLLPMCSNVFRSNAGGDDGAIEDSVVELDARTRRDIERQADQLASRGYRVLAVAERRASGRGDLREDQIGALSFAGLLALADPVRLTAALAIAGVRAAGVDVMMLTGDHPSTAQAIGAELGLLDGRRVVTGSEIDRLSDAELDAVVGNVAVFARVSPDHKVRIVAALRRAGRVVAVTGDGANDAPAIRLADVGVALGRRGTNAAKEAADIVVTDDKIETIIDAIAEGRAMWSSVRDAIAMLLGGNLGEVAFTIGTALMRPGGPVLGARQLLLVNLLTDMIPSLALAVREPTAATPQTLLGEGPEVSLGSALIRDIVVRGGLTAASGLGAWVGGRLTGVTARRASTVALVGLVGAQLGQTLAAGWRSPPVVAASLGSAAALAGVVQTPGLSQFFGCRPLGPVGWGVGMSWAAAASIAAPLLAAGKPGSKPDAAQPDAAQPDAAQPDAARPDAVRPDAAQPDGAVQPDAVKPLWHQTVQGEDGVAGCLDRLVDRLGRVVARVEARERRRRLFRHGLRRRRSGPAADVVAPGYRGRGAGVDRLARCLGEQVRPGSGDDLDQLVPAATGEQPPAARDLVRELVNGRVRCPLGVYRQPEVGQRVHPVGVAAVLADQDLRAELAQQRRHDGVERAQPARVAGACGQRHVDREAEGVRPACFGRPARAWEQRGRVLVQADRQHPRVVVEDRLHPVAVVHVDVDVRDALGAARQQPGDRDRRIVVDAEPAGPIGHRVMQPARDVRPVLGVPRPYRPGGRQRRASDQRGCLVHTCEDRVVLGAEAERERAGQPVGRWRGCQAPRLCQPAELAHRGDVARVVHEFKLGVRGWLGRDDVHARQVEHAERPGQLDGQLDSDRRERVRGAEVISGQPVIPRDVHGAGHRPILRFGHANSVPMRGQRNCFRWSM